MRRLSKIRAFANAEAGAAFDPRPNVGAMDVAGREALAKEESPYGVVGAVHSGADLAAWWIWKDHEDVEPTFAVMDREDLLYVIHGSLRLELEGGESHVLGPGSAYVIPAGRRFRGCRWPRDGDPCLFLAVAPTGANFTRISCREDATSSSALTPADVTRLRTQVGSSPPRLRGRSASRGEAG